MARILVTGATGFIGRHLCSHLLGRGHQVRAALRRTPAPTDFPREMETVEVGEIGAQTDWTKALEGVDFVVHLAGLAHQISSPARMDSDPFFAVNSRGTRRLAESVKSTASVQRLVFVSSVGVVRSFSSEPITASTPCEPDSPYTRSKLDGEKAIEETLSDGKPDWCILRPPLVYGAGNPGNMERLIRVVERGLPLPLATVRNRRSLLFVGNLVSAIELCMTHPKALRKTFVLRDGQDVSTPDLLRKVAQLRGKKARLFPFPLFLLRMMGRMGVGIDRYSMDRICGSLLIDDSDLRNQLGWKPPYSLDEGLARTFLQTQPR